MKSGMRAVGAGCRSHFVIPVGRPQSKTFSREFNDSCEFGPRHLLRRGRIASIGGQRSTSGKTLPVAFVGAIPVWVPRYLRRRLKVAAFTGWVVCALACWNAR